jgi:hypothetical protein
MTHLLEPNNEQLEHIKRMAAAAFSYHEIADVLEVKISELKPLITDEGNPIFKAYRTGYLTRQLELRERIFKDAKNGSSPAQTTAYKLMEDVEIKNKL